MCTVAIALDTAPWVFVPTVTPKHSGQYRWRYAGTKTHGAVSSAIATVHVR